MKKPYKKTIFDISGRTALVTGASRGLGKAIAIALANAGADLVICSQHQERLEESASEIRKLTGASISTIAVDLTKRQNLHILSCRVLELTGKLDILICNAGVDHIKNLDQIDNETWDYDFELNLTSCMILTRALAPQMKKQKWGRIIYISSVLGLSGREGRIIYSATKSALIGLARSVAIDLGPFGVTVNCIAPGPFNVKTPNAMLSVRQKNNFKKWTPLERWGRPEEIAGPVLLLSSEAGSYITGTTLVVDGGVLCKSF